MIDIYLFYLNFENKESPENYLQEVIDVQTMERMVNKGAGSNMFHGGHDNFHFGSDGDNNCNFSSSKKTHGNPTFKANLVLIYNSTIEQIQGQLVNNTQENMIIVNSYEPFFFLLETFINEYSASRVSFCTQRLQKWRQ